MLKGVLVCLYFSWPDNGNSVVRWDLVKQPLLSAAMALSAERNLPTSKASESSIELRRYTEFTRRIKCGDYTKLYWWRNVLAVSVFERHIFHGLWDKQTGKRALVLLFQLFFSLSSFSMLEPVSRPAGMTEGRTCLCRVQVLKGFIFPFLSSNPFRRCAPWDQLSCLLGRSTPCNALLLALSSASSSEAMS